MKSFDLSKAARSVKTGLMKHSPEILVCFGIAGMITTTVMAVRATPKALELIDEEKKKQDVKKLEPIDVIKVTWKNYIPPVVTGTVSIACIVGASSANLRRNAALAAAYTLSETTFKEYKDKVVDTVGERKEKTIKDAVEKEKIEKNPVKSNEVIITGKGKTLCYDAVSGRYFECDIDLIRKAEATLGLRMRTEMYVSLNDFYYEIGLSPIKLGDELGWNVDDGYISLDFSSQIADNGQPCLVIDYDIAPRYDYYGQ